VRCFADLGALIDAERVGLEHPKPVTELLLELSQGRQAASVAFHRHYPSTGIEQRSSKAPRARTHFVNSLPLQIAGNGRNPCEQLSVENEILAERLVGRQPMPRDDVSQRLGGRAHAPSER